MDRSRRILTMFALIVAGEAVFGLPFHVARFFRPTMLEVFGLSPTQLGAVQGVYGVVAMLAYFPGGPLADRFSARRLMAFSLWTTALGGVYLATFPGYREALALWGFFGVTTILLFWAALIRATREWGGPALQGRAFGVLDAGRGVLAASLASVGVVVFALAFPDGSDAATLEQQARALRRVILGYTAATALAGVLVWFALDDRSGHGGSRAPRATWKGVLAVIRMRAVWLQAVVLLCAYFGYKGFDNTTLYAVDGYGLDPVEAARVATIGSWMRPVGALGAGLLGDRFGRLKMTFLAFVVLLGSELFFALSTPVPGATWILLTNVIIGCLAFFGLRGLYFAVFDEVRVPLAFTGAAVGVISVIGYLPDVFINYVAGRLVDASPGVEGHQNFYAFLSVFAAVGCLVSGWLWRDASRENSRVS